MTNITGIIIAISAFVLAIALGWVTINTSRKERVRTRGFPRRSLQWIYKKKQPFTFWGIITAYLTVVIALLWLALKILGLL